MGQVSASATEARGELRLSFLTSGDDGNEGEASAYRAALSTTVFQSDAEVSIEPGCIGDGDNAICTLESRPCSRSQHALEATIQGLMDETEYYLIVFAVDDEGNRGSTPTNAIGGTLRVPPTLEEPTLVEDVDARGVAISYIAPGDNELSGDDVRTELHWGYAPEGTTVCLNGSVNANTELLPAVDPGTPATFSLTNLETDRLLCIQLIATDDQPISTATTIHEAYLDTTPPAAVTSPDFTTTAVPTELQVEFNVPDATALPNVITTYFAIIKPEQLDNLPVSVADVSCSRGALCQVGQGLSFLELEALQSMPQGRIQGHLTGLDAETAYYISIVGIDEDQNVGELPVQHSDQYPTRRTRQLHACSRRDYRNHGRAYLPRPRRRQWPRCV